MLHHTWGICITINITLSMKYYFHLSTRVTVNGTFRSVISSSQNYHREYNVYQLNAQLPIVRDVLWHIHEIT